MTASVHYLSTLAFDEEFLDRLRAVSPLLTVEQITAGSPEDIPPQVWAQVDILHTSSVFPSARCAPALRWIQLDSSGADHLRGQPIWDSDISITTLGGVGPVSMAEYVTFSVLALAHRLPALVETRNARLWPDPGPGAQRFTPAPVRGTTMVILGYGRIGQEIARLAAPFGIRVIGVSRGGVQDTSQELLRYDGRRVAARPAAPRHRTVDSSAPVVATVDQVALVAADRLDEVLGLADWLVVVVPHTPDTHRMLDARRLGRVKPGAMLINVSRGGVVDESALLGALRSGRIAGAALDVFESEPLPATSPWWTEPGVLLTPHVGGLTADYGAHVEQIVTGNLERFLAGGTLLNVVDRGRGY